MSSSFKPYLEYHPLFLENLRRTGIIQTACELTGINYLNFLSWKSQFPEFVQLVQEAELFHQENRGEILKQEAERSLVDHLLGKVKKYSRSVTTVYDPRGNIISTIETVKEQNVPPTLRMIEFVLFGASNEERRALNVLARSRMLSPGLKKALSGILDQAAEAFSNTMAGEYSHLEVETDSSQRGISDETANAIRAKILGLDSGNSKTIEAAVTEVMDDQSSLAREESQ